MIGYVTIGVSDMERAKTFYCDLFAERDAKVIIDAGRIAFIGNDPKQPLLAVCEPWNKEPCDKGNGNMVAFVAKDKEEAAALHAKALSLGATDDGEPGQRVPDMFYGAYARDFDGNKLCFFVFG